MEYFGPVGSFVSFEQCCSIFPWFVALVSDCMVIWHNGKHPALVNPLLSVPAWASLDFARVRIWSQPPLERLFWSPFVLVVFGNVQPIRIHLLRKYLKAWGGSQKGRLLVTLQEDCISPKMAAVFFTREFSRWQYLTLGRKDYLLKLKNRKKKL